MTSTDRIGQIRWREGFREIRRNAYVAPWKGLGLWLRHRGTPYQNVPPSQWASYKKSDTVFIIGSGPSIERLTPADWQHIRQHDTFGINYSFVKGIPTTYHLFAYEPKTASGDVAGTFRDVFTPDLRKLYSNTLWFLPSKAIFRMVHPRILPDYFPEHPKVGIFHLPNPVRLESDRPFKAEDFSTSLSYRGSIGLVMTLIDRLAYRRIVLLGVDPQTAQHFVYQHPALQDEAKKYYSISDPKGQFESMTPKKAHYRTIVEYYIALRELYFQPKGVQLYMGVENPLLTPRIPIYPGGLHS